MNAAVSNYFKISSNSPTARATLFDPFRPLRFLHKRICDANSRRIPTHATNGQQALAYEVPKVVGASATRPEGLRKKLNHRKRRGNV